MYLINENTLKNEAEKIGKEGKIPVYELENLLNFSLEQNTDLSIEYAKNVLKQNGYIVSKWTKLMDVDANECEEMEEKGQSKDCRGCSCAICLAQ